MSTRLDRLFCLLDTGSTMVVRKTAAEQIGTVIKNHPEDLQIILFKLHEILGKPSWETRIAAGLAVEAVVSQVPPFSPDGSIEPNNTLEKLQENYLRFKDFNISLVLKQRTLVGSEGCEYDASNDTGESKEDLIKREREAMNKNLSLGLPSVSNFLTDLVEDDDLVKHPSTAHSANTPDNLSSIFKSNQSLSVREKNKLKRKVKAFTRQSSHSGNVINDDEAKAGKRSRSSSVSVDSRSNSPACFDNEPEDWPLAKICETLLSDLINCAWEKRHGSAVALRHILKHHASSAGKSNLIDKNLMELANQSYLENIAVRLIGLLILDRFGDFISDEVVAPVRESASQALGVVMQNLPTESVNLSIDLLLEMLDNDQWEVRHGGLLAIKYTMAVRADMTSIILPKVFQPVFNRLSDKEDDVKSVAAMCLIPVVNTLACELDTYIPSLVERLWDSLVFLDDLTASTNSFMNLLALIMPKVAESRDQNLKMNMNVLKDLIPRLWPFFSHNISSVRKSSFQTLYTLLTSAAEKEHILAWLLPILEPTMRLLYQQSLLESEVDILWLTEKIWGTILDIVPAYQIFCCTSQHLGIWLSLGMQPAYISFSLENLLLPKHGTFAKRPDNEDKLYLGGREAQVHGNDNRDVYVTRSRIFASRLLGQVFKNLSINKVEVPNGQDITTCLSNMIIFHLQNKSALQRMFASLVLQEWWNNNDDLAIPKDLDALVFKCLTEPVYFDEIAVQFTKMQAACKDIMFSLKSFNIDVNEFEKSPVLTIEMAEKFCTRFYPSIKSKIKKNKEEFDARINSLSTTVAFTANEQKTYNIRVGSLLACCKVCMKSIPDQINPVIRPLMEALRKERNIDLQKIVAKRLSALLKILASRSSSPIEKIIRNLSNLICVENENIKDELLAENNGTDIKLDKFYGILALSLNDTLQKTTKNYGKRENGVDVALDNNLDTSSDSCRGAKIALSQVLIDQGAELPVNIESLWSLLVGAIDKVKNLTDLDTFDKDDTEAKNLINCFTLLHSLLIYLHRNLHEEILNRLDSITKCLFHPYTTVRNTAAKCFAKFTHIDILQTMQHYLENISPVLSSENVRAKQGAISALHYLIETVGFNVAPYSILLFVPVLGCMSDQDKPVRMMANQCFGQLIRMISLEMGIPNPPSMKSELIQRKKEERKFIEQLLDGSKLDYFDIPIPIKAEPRKYQQDGINWLAFLNKYKLHGALCDDMGLGKTLQTLCVVAGDHFIRQKKYETDPGPDCEPLLSLIICPPTLTGHWVFEMEKFVDKKYLNPLHYTGTPMERNLLQKEIDKHNVVVSSYDVVRNDIEFFEKINWNYCILDEGHVIKNSKTKLWKAMKRLVSLHRLILSGTPIQNSVLELWSLFDFLMPGYLGTQKQFQVRYGKPISASKDSKSSSKEQEAGALAMEALHKQVLPFILRRMKSDVLTDLPPKIVQDMYCSLSPLQIELYEDFSKSKALKTVENDVSHFGQESSAKKASNHIFQALQYLRKVCSHPSLVLNKNHPKYEETIQKMKKDGSNINDIQHAPKLAALKQLLIDCDIGVNQGSLSDVPVVGQNRALIFCQLKSMLDIVEKDLLKVHLPNATYLRLDGSIPPGNRHNIVHRFNTDPSIDILLLTTHVGGLGLNLTGANTIIFVEHDWNPSRDSQAMDRAHRIGQKRVVNVYRLITKGTLEEKIMGLQKFKLAVAQSIVSADNANLSTMATDQLLDLFTVEKSYSPRKKNSSGSGVKSVLENLEELWDEEQYEEYELDKFLQSLHK